MSRDDDIFCGDRDGVCATKEETFIESDFLESL